MKTIQSYMELCINRKGEENLYLRVPTFWDAINKQWVGFIKTPTSQTLIKTKGKNSHELKNDCDQTLNSILEKDDEIAEELFNMFMPSFYPLDA